MRQPIEIRRKPDSVSVTIERCAQAKCPVLHIAGSPLLEFNASHYTAEDLYVAKHTTDLAPRAETIAYLDAAHRGLGSGSCGPDTTDANNLTAKRYSFGYSLITL